MTIVMPKISRKELEELQVLHHTKNKKENFPHYQRIITGLKLPTPKNIDAKFDDAVRMHLSVHRARITLSEKKLKQGSKIMFQGRPAIIQKVVNFNEEVTMYPFGGYAVIISFPDGTAKKCVGTMVESFVKAS
jgi:hypothetical protein